MVGPGESGWQSLASWWLNEQTNDRSYADDLDPLILNLGQPLDGRVILDVGCGEGRLLAKLIEAGAIAFGVDGNSDLLHRAVGRGPVARLHLPELNSVHSDSFDDAIVCLVLEHLEDHQAFLAELSRVVRPGGRLILIVNHPVFTAPGSAPIQDADGEVLWRPGEYFSRGHTDEPTGDGTVRFHHRTTGELLTAAAVAGWGLEVLREVGPLPTQVEQSPALAEQAHIPRILAVRWRLR